MVDSKTLSCVFSDLLEEADTKGFLKKQSFESLQWYRQKVEDSKLDIEKYDLRREKYRSKLLPEIGKMYMFRYQPKYSKTLPYYDKFPLVMPIQPTIEPSNCFIGLNFHYLPLTLRAKLFDALHGLINNQEYDSSTRLLITYNILKRYSKYSLFKPTIKKYLYNHMQTKFIYIKPIEWQIALFLPTERFVKKSKQDVWDIVRSNL